MAVWVGTVDQTVAVVVDAVAARMFVRFGGRIRVHTALGSTLLLQIRIPVLAQGPIRHGTRCPPQTFVDVTCSIAIRPEDVAVSIAVRVKMIAPLRLWIGIRGPCQQPGSSQSTFAVAIVIQRVVAHWVRVGA